MSDFTKSKLYQAVQKDNAAEVKQLLAAGEDPNLQDEKGQTYLHHAILKPVSRETFRALLDKVDISERDENGECILDLALENERTPEWAEEEVRSWVMKEILEMDEDTLERLVLGGWPYFPTDHLDQIRARSEEAADFLQNMPNFEEKVKLVHDAIYEGDLRLVQAHMDRKKLAYGRDHTGKPPLQKAIIFEETPIIRYILENFIDAVKIKDNMGRTALHFAGPMRDGGHIYKILLSAGADETVKDVTGRTPKDYKEHPEHLNVKVIQRRLRGLAEKPARRIKSRPASAITESAGLSRGDTGLYADVKPSPGASARISESLRGLAVAADLHVRRNVPPPDAPDSKYVAEQLGGVLTAGLAEVCAARPWDPVEYLAHYLYKHADNQAFAKKRINLVKELAEDEKAREREKEARAHRREEMKRIKMEEERRKKEEEEEKLRRQAEKERLENAPNLPTLKEEAEPEVDASSRGRTKLHQEAMVPDGNVASLIVQGFSVADRDWQGKTPRDLALEHGCHENVKAIDEYVASLVEVEKGEQLMPLLLMSYDIPGDLGTSLPEVPEDMQAFLTLLPTIKEKLASLHASLVSGKERDSLGYLDRKEFLKSRDKHGSGVLHLAVMGESAKLVKYVLEHRPTAVSDKDNVGRTPLHVAAGLGDEGYMFQVLTDIGQADATTKDYEGNTPQHYLDTPGSLDTRQIRREVYGVDDAQLTSQPEEEEKEADMGEEDGEAEEEGDKGEGED